MHVAVTDVKNFFLQARMPDEKVYYAEIPPGWDESTPGRNVAKVLAPLVWPPRSCQDGR